MQLRQPLRPVSLNVRKAIRKPCSRKSRATKAAARPNPSRQTPPAASPARPDDSNKENAGQIEPCSPVHCQSVFNDTATDATPEQKLQDCKREKKDVKCERLSLKEEETGKAEDFRLYKENELEFLSAPVMRVELSEISCDNDCQTENEQISSSINSIDTELMHGIEAFGRDRLEVHNMRKFEEDRVALLKQHRVY